MPLGRGGVHTINLRTDPARYCKRLYVMNEFLESNK